MYRYKQKKGKKKREAETSLYSLALRNAQRSYKTQLSLATLLIRERDFCHSCPKKNWSKTEDFFIIKLLYIKPYSSVKEQKSI